MFGAESVGASTTTRYLLPSYSDTLATSSPVQVEIPSGVTSFDFVRMDIRHNSPAGNGNDIVYTLRVNGVASLLTLTLASTATSATVTATVAISAGDLLDIEVTKAATVAASPTGVVALVEAAA